MTQENVSQVTDWKGQSRERWVVPQARLDAMMAAFGQPQSKPPRPYIQGLLDPAQIKPKHGAPVPSCLLQM
jgi:hypothetical protein